MTPPKKSNTNIESKLHELEGILEELESGELDLDDALKKFEKGIKLSRECQKTLEEAELKIKVLMGDELKDSDETLSQ
ncbi:MAG: exodeoxyribonuclease VII small subunit [Pseudomonadota bacterium]|jgi:exodeoxyribonuclease VII small subunit|nr:exodeoxyribonuclease VII small subunit [Pseudomonadota bacterium]MEC9064282.1 exodeoxyribonuclease VII small subunit [Pseudomonadota bacterium]MED5270571.1 exodeoxyribonuclease VII small subunit [Pseudomonadota bacterium]MED6343160.1 exodeoxyribonuclease VII small subunit [Pseudomonadota bacterium]|tara:strand:+ start:432 stop:665 length:234 start_codon:yes stop_codon:yes gene_type:complete